MRDEARIHVTVPQALGILRPYAQARLSEQLRSVLPIVGYLFLFQWLVLRMPVVDVAVISLGLTAVILGLMVFMEGLRIGLMPFGETIGATLPAKSSLAVILGFAFLLGVGATLAEPAVGTLKSAGINIKPAEAPLLYVMLTRYSGWLVMAVALGVGVATVLGMLRFLGNWSLKTLIVPLVLLLTAMTLWAQAVPNLAHVIGLAWDTGGVTTGPVTVPLVLALGIGVCRVMGKSDADFLCAGQRDQGAARASQDRHQPGEGSDRDRGADGGGRRRFRRAGRGGEARHPRDGVHLHDACGQGPHVRPAR